MLGPPAQKKSGGDDPVRVCRLCDASAVATAWARASFDEFGVANGNASRYTIFGAYLMLGQIYYFATGVAQGWWEQSAQRVL